MIITPSEVVQKVSLVCPEIVKGQGLLAWTILIDNSHDQISEILSSAVGHTPEIFHKGCEGPTI